MILQALTDYYRRKENDLPPVGFERKEIPFVIVIDRDGRFVQLLDTRRADDGGKLRAREFEVPQSVGRSGSKSYEVTFPLWDHYGYVLGQPKVSKPGEAPSEKDRQMAERQHRTFRERVSQIAASLPDDAGVHAVHQFLESPADIDRVRASPEMEEVLSISGCNLTFQLADEEYLICQSPTVQQWVTDQQTKEGDTGICLVSGERRPIATLHYMIKGVWGAQTSGASLVSFNADSFTSRNKSQGENSPVSEKAVFEYATALNHLLRRGSSNRFQMADTSVVCWSDQETPLETAVPVIFGSWKSDNPDSGVDSVTALMNSIHSGAYVASDGENRFHILGLSPNASRIAVRFWITATVGQFAEQISQWFADVSVERRDDVRYPTFKALLASTALLGREDNLPPNLAGETMRTILYGLPLPASLLQAVLKRIKSEQGRVYPDRAALIKACLNRRIRFGNQQKKEIDVSYDPEETRIGYRLGSLFAVLEKLQKDANPGLNATIRDRYYSSASCTPRSVFGTLMRMHTHHLKKLDNPAWQQAAQRRIGEIMAPIDDFPSHLGLEDQGLFAIGYYHQQQALYRKKDVTDEGDD